MIFSCFNCGFEDADCICIPYCSRHNWEWDYKNPKEKCSLCQQEYKEKLEYQQMLEPFILSKYELFTLMLKL